MRPIDISSVTVAGPPGSTFQFYSYQSVSDVDPFNQPERLFIVPWLAPFNSHRIAGLIGQRGELTTIDLKTLDKNFVHHYYRFTSLTQIKGSQNGRLGPYDTI